MKSHNDDCACSQCYREEGIEEDIDPLDDDLDDCLCDEIPCCDATCPCMRCH